MALVRQKADPAQIGIFRLAQNLIKASRIYVFDKEGYGDKIIPYLVEQLKTSSRNPTDLIKVASHTCTIELLQLTLENLARDVENLKEAGEDEMIEIKIKSTLQTIAVVLGQGFDAVEDNKFIKDASGKPIGIKEDNIGRYPECHKALQSGEPLGGKRKRRTKKRVLKKRKTLRRTRH